MEMIAKIVSGKTEVVQLQIKKDMGEIQRKNISFRRFIDIINDSVVNIDNMIQIGPLPNGYYSGEISPEREYSFNCVLIVPEGLRPFYYMDEIFMIPFPVLVFYFMVLDGRMTFSKCYAMKKGSVTEDSILYHYPFGNVYDDGKICWGKNKLPEIKRMKELETLVSLFFGSPTNNDLYNPSSILKCSEEYVLTQRGLLEHIKGLEMFPENILHCTGNKLGSLIG